MRTCPRLFLILLIAALVATAAACGGDDDEDPAAAPTTTAEATPTLAGADLEPVKSYLLDHTEQLESFAADFEAAATRYDELAAAADYNYADLFETQGDDVVKALADAKRLWIAGNPAYEQMEGIVAARRRSPATT